MMCILLPYIYLVKLVIILEHHGLISSISESCRYIQKPYPTDDILLYRGMVKLQKIEMLLGPACFQSLSSLLIYDGNLKVHQLHVQLHLLTTCKVYT